MVAIEHSGSRHAASARRGRRRAAILTALAVLIAAPAAAQQPASEPAGASGQPAATSPSTSPPQAAGPPLQYINPNAPLPPMTIVAQQEQMAPAERAFSADGNVIVTGGREFELHADHIAGDLATGIVQASGNIYVRELRTTITGSTAHFNLKGPQGVFTSATLSQPNITITARDISVYPDHVTAFGASVSTCPPGVRQDYHVQARSLVYNARAYRLVAIGASFYLGRTRLFYLPYFVIPLARPGGHPSVAQTIRQQAGYSQYDGAYLLLGAQPRLFHNPLAVSVVLPTRSAVEATASTTFPIFVYHPRSKPTTKPGPVAVFREFAIGKPSLLPPGDPLLFHNFGVPGPFDKFLASYADHPSLTGTVTLADHERMFGKSVNDLTLTRLPEGSLGIYVPLMGHQGLPGGEDPVAVRRALRKIVLRLSIDPQWGDYHEYPTNASHSRTAVDATLEARPLLIGPNTLFLPRIGIQSNTYSGGLSYHYFQYDLGVQHYVTDRTAYGMEYIKSEVGGQSPFVWDALDTAQELDLRGQYGDRDHIIGLLMRYDLNGHDAYDWDLTLGRVLHCLIPTINYDARSHNIGIGLNVQGITF